MMKIKICLRIVLVLVLLAGGDNLAQALTVLGNDPFYGSPLHTVDDLYSMVEKEKDQIKIGLRAVGLRPLYDSFISQISTTEIRTVEYTKGTTMEWMFFRKKGTGPLRIDYDVVWEGDEPFAAYEFDIEYDDRLFTFTVPLLCGNFTLMKVGEKSVAMESPISTEEKWTEPVATAPLVTEPGPEAKIWSIVADLGMYRQFDPATYMLARVGFEWSLSDRMSILTLAGVAPKIEGTDGECAAILDVIVNWYFSSFYVGIGMGGWITDGDDDNDSEDSDFNFLLSVGTNLYEKPESFRLSLFFEARSGVDEIDDFTDYGYLGGGVRFHF